LWTRATRCCLRRSQPRSNKTTTTQRKFLHRAFVGCWHAQQAATPTRRLIEYFAICSHVRGKHLGTEIAGDPRVGSELRCIHPCPVENSNSGHTLPWREAQALQSYAYRLLLVMSAAMACPSGRVGEQLERHADKHRFPMRIRPGDRPPVQRSVNRPFNVELLQALEGRSGNWAALRPFESGPVAHPRRVIPTLYPRCMPAHWSGRLTRHV
jgi:hypothetical protein